MLDKLKIVFAGTPEIASTVLEKLITEKFQVDLVLTQPDRPAGRGMKLTSSPVKELAIENGIEVFQPVKFRNNPDAIHKIKDLQPDIMVVVAYGLILPQELLDIPKLGCVNIHVSLLPKLRGAAPIQRALLAGDSKTGVTIMQMDAGLDTGDILLVEEVNIDAHDTSQTLHDKLAKSGATKIVEYLHDYKTITPVKQDNNQATYAEKLLKSEGLVNWNESAEIIERKIRGYNPFPGVYSYLDGKLYKFWQSTWYDNTTVKTYNSGEIIKAEIDGLHIACGCNSVLVIKEIQEAGSKRKPIDVFLQGKDSLIGQVFVSELVSE